MFWINAEKAPSMIGPQKDVYIHIKSILSQCASVFRPQNLTKMILLDPDVLGTGVSSSHQKQIWGEFKRRMVEPFDQNTI